LSSGIAGQFIHSPLILILFLVALLLAKVWATALTLGGGGNGGNFAPSLFTGALLGFTFVFGLNQLNVIQTPAANFTLVGMCGVLTGIFHSPLTAIFLIAEITGGYELIIPLMIVAAISLSVSRYLQPKSLDAIKLAEKGHEHTHDQDTHILNAMPFESLIETDFALVYENEKLGDLVKRISKSKRNIFPVVNEEKRLLGVILLDDVREKIFQTELYTELNVQELMQPPPATIDLDEKMVSVMEKFDRTKAWNLPVLSGKSYRGFVSKSKIFTEYRKRLQEQSLDF
jgi:CIC family chloride channel protein